VVDADGERHPAVGRLVAEQDALPGSSVACALSTRCGSAVASRGSPSVPIRQLVGGTDVLAVDDLRGDRDGRRVIQECHLVGHRDDVAVLERDDPA
jgi:hypothetical protein